MFEENKNPWLSLVIPSFEYDEGVLRILNLLELSGESNIECLISDDSKSTKVETVVKNHSLYKEGRIKYVRNKTPLGAIKNWNRLINKAVGDYILVLHQDECPENINFFNNLREDIKEFNEPDIIFLRCSHITLFGTFFQFHMPYFISKKVLQFKPEILLVHNFVGSPSNVVFKQNKKLLFDEKLKWLVDVDWIVRLLNQRNIKWIFKKNLSIISIVHPETSITASLGSEIKVINNKEIKLIRDKSNYSKTLFSILVPVTLYNKALKFLENIAWGILYLLLFTTSLFSLRLIPSWWKELGKK